MSAACMRTGAACFVAALLACTLLAPAWSQGGGSNKVSPSASAGVHGSVSSVIDGDTLWFAPRGGGKPVQVRLAGIDAPEICQEGGAEAKRYLAELTAQQPVRLVVQPAQASKAPPAAKDGAVPTLGTLYFPEGEVNRRMVEEGQAWSIRVKWDQGPYVTQERMAKALSRGVHRTGSGVMPKDFRLRHGPCPAEAAVPPAPPSAAPRKP